jgi:hypothetical protein
MSAVSPPFISIHNKYRIDLFGIFVGMSSRAQVRDASKPPRKFRLTGFLKRHLMFSK